MVTRRIEKGRIKMENTDDTLQKILKSVKVICDVAIDDTSFDKDLILYINSVFSILKQLGVTDTDFKLVTGEELWSDYLSDFKDIEDVKTYIGLKVKKMFDPPSGSSMQAIDDMIRELEWRINVAVDPKKEESNG